MKELAIPASATSDKAAVEVVRVWLADGKQHVSLMVGAWEEPGVWGMLLADLARHIANAFQQQVNAEPEETLEAIRRYFDMELDSPTDFPVGTIVRN